MRVSVMVEWDDRRSTPSGLVIPSRSVSTEVYMDDKDELPDQLRHLCVMASLMISTLFENAVDEPLPAPKPKSK